MPIPGPEVCYQWMEFECEEGGPPGLAVPLLQGESSGKVEFFEMEFFTPEEAEDWRLKTFPYAEWILCQEIILPLHGYRRCPLCHEVRKYAIDSSKGVPCEDCTGDEDGWGEHEYSEDET